MLLVSNSASAQNRTLSRYCVDWFEQISKKIGFSSSRRLPEPPFVNLHNVPAGKLLIDHKPIQLRQDGRGIMFSELKAQIVTIGDGELRLLAPDVETINRMWGLTEGSPLRFVWFGEQPNYEREIANRRIPIVGASAFLTQHDYIYHLVGYKILMDRGEFIQYADAMKACFAIVDSPITISANREIAKTFIRRFASGLEQASAQFSTEDLMGVKIAQSVAEQEIHGLRTTLQEFTKFISTMSKF